MKGAKTQITQKNMEESHIEYAWRGTAWHPSGMLRDHTHLKYTLLLNYHTDSRYNLPAIEYVGNHESF